MSISIFGFKQHGKGKVIFFGDSITAFGVNTDGYISNIDSIITAEGTRENYELVGAGVPGNRVEDLFKRLDQDVLSRNSDAVVIWKGVNDVWNGKFVTDSSKMMFSFYHSSILQRLMNARIEAIMCTPGTVGEKKYS